MDMETQDMKDADTECDNQLLFRQRKDRLRSFVLMGAPDQIIGGACELVLRSLYGNSRLRLIWHLVTQVIGHGWQWYVDGPIRRKMCRIGFHSVDETGYRWCCPIEAEGEEEEAEEGVTGQGEQEQYEEDYDYENSCFLVPCLECGKSKVAENEIYCEACFGRLEEEGFFGA
jgi:hypothetical protein